MAKQVKALQLLSHIIPHEGKLIVPKSSLRNRPLVFLPIPPPLLPKDTPQEGRFVSLWLVCSPHTHGVRLGGLVVVCTAVVRGRPTVCPAPTLPLCVSVTPTFFPSCTTVSLVGPVETTELGTTFKPPTCQRLFIRSKACSQGLIG